MSKRYQEILNFWFAGIDAQGRVPDETSSRWWKKDETFDQFIRDEFLSDLEAASQGDYNSWLAEAPSRLALIILLDQFSRNIFRNQARSYAQDEQALHIAHEGIVLQHDQALWPIQQVFFYMPFEHAEDRQLQVQSVTLFQQLIGQVPGSQRPIFSNFYDYALRHKAVIDRFGRFPHRNAALSRQSTEEELQFLTEPHSSF